VRFARGDITSDVPVVLLAIRRVHQDADVLADYVVRRVTEHFLRSAVEREHRAALVDDDHGIDGRIEQRLKLCANHCGVFRFGCRRFGHT
jgi:hypothetical protein